MLLVLPEIASVIVYLNVVPEDFASGFFQQLYSSLWSLD